MQFSHGQLNRPPASLFHTRSNAWPIALVWLVVSGSASAQTSPAIASAETTAALPDAPRPQVQRSSGDQEPAAQQGTSSIFGTVLDGSGAIIAGAQVTLTDAAGAPLSSTASGSGGTFTFARIAAGSYSLLIQAAGFQTRRSSEINLSADQAFVLPAIDLQIATASTSVEVRPTDIIAAEQIRAEEKQRILGIIPNFYTSFVRDAAPLTPRQKLSLTFHDTFDPTRFVGSAIQAGIEQVGNTYAGYGDGGAGYAKRYAAAYGNGLTQDILSHAVFPVVFHQDPRYFYQGTGTTKSRLMHAISFAAVVRTDSGGTAPNYSYLLGDIGSGLLSNLYYPHADRGVGLVFTNAAIGIAGRAGGSIIREFFLKRVTTNVPSGGRP